MDKLGVSVSSFDCDIIRGAFKNSVIEKNIPEDRWRDYAAQMVRDFTGSDDIDSDLLEWIVRK
ncbi:hypothetical protein [Mesorhizobium sp. P5_C1]